jgi:hypothetical protein
MSGSGGLRRILATPRVTPLALSVLATTIGTGMITTGGLVFFVQSSGLKTSDIVVGMTAAGVVGLLVAVFMGDLADRRGGGRYRHQRGHPVGIHHDDHRNAGRARRRHAGAGRGAPDRSRGRRSLTSALGTGQGHRRTSLRVLGRARQRLRGRRGRSRAGRRTHLPRRARAMIYRHSCRRCLRCREGKDLRDRGQSIDPAGANQTADRPDAPATWSKSRS